jgi:hypothetical protein
LRLGQVGSDRPADAAWRGVLAFQDGLLAGEHRLVI